MRIKIENIDRIDELTDHVVMSIGERTIECDILREFAGGLWGYNFDSPLFDAIFANAYVGPEFARNYNDFWDGKPTHFPWDLGNFERERIERAFSACGKSLDAFLDRGTV